MQTHFLPPRSIPLAPRSYAAWARIQPTKLVLFVHGFRGGALSTWRRFDELLPSEDRCASVDHIFYGYDAFTSDLMASAAELREFLKTLLVRPWSLSDAMLPVQAKRTEWHYDQIFLVGHSLGAVILRRALLELRSLRAPNLETMRLVLYAPAHRGAHLAKLFGETFSSISLLNFFAGYLKFKSPLIDQLLPDSQELRDLRRSTEEALASGDSDYMNARDVFIAKREHVVLNLQFCSDPVPTVIDSDHMGICKPDSEHSLGFGHLVNAITGKAAKA